MRIEKIDINSLPTVYGIKGEIIGLPNEPVNMGAMVGVLRPGETTQYHAHHDYEIFIIHEGHGVMTVDQCEQAVNKGDKIYLLPRNGHLLKNNHAMQNLTFISIWWAAAEGALIPKPVTMPLKKKHLIIAPPPTPNGDLHVGHLAGPYLSADILKRFLQQNGHQVAYIAGSDDHQSYVKLKAEQSKIQEKNIIETYSVKIQQVFNKINASPDIFYRPLKDTNYIRFVQTYFQDLFNSGAIKVKSIEQAYCDDCQQYLREADLNGLCPYCACSCGGNSCESCGMPNSCVDIINAMCKVCRNSTKKRTVNRVCLELENYREALQKYLQQLNMPSHVRSLVRKLMEKRLPDIPIAYPGDWGIVAPFFGFNDQKLCSWCEMAPGYIYASCLAQNCNPTEIESAWLKAWNNTDIETTLLFGFDNSFFYTILMPALLLASTALLRLPDRVIYNEFYLLDDKKFSKSRDHVVLAKDILAQVPDDCLRYYLAATRPEVEKTRFNYNAFIDVINNDLVEHLSTWISHLASRLKTDFNNVCPDGGLWCQEHDKFINYLHSFIEHFPSALNIKIFSTSYAIELLRELMFKAEKLAICNSYLQGNNAKNKLDYQTGIVLELTALKYYALACYAIMPKFAGQLADVLGLKNDLVWETELRLLPKETVINNLQTCTFQRLDVGLWQPMPLAS